MSKRYPLSRASKLYGELAPKLEPYLSRADPTIDFTSSLTQEFVDNIIVDFHFRNGASSDAASLIYAAAAKTRAQLIPDDLVWAARWRSCRQVYRIDPTIASELTATDLDDEIPCSVFARLPYPIIYIDVFVTVPLSDGTPMRCVGFIAFTTTDVDGSRIMSIVLLGEDGGRIPLTFPVEGERSLREFIERSGAVRLENGELVSDFDLDDAEHARGVVEYVTAMRTIVGSLLFIISKESGAEVIYAPPKTQRNQKPGKRTNMETVTQVGAKLGRAIGAARRASSTSNATASEPTGRTAAPHIRRAHWQSFWTGKRKDRTDAKFGDELVVRWIPPIEVNADHGEPAETIHL